MKKYLWIFLLSASILFAFSGCSSNGTADTAGSFEDGTISSAADLLALASDSSGWSGDYLLTCNISLSDVCNASDGSWTPIGNATTLFTGTFDGAGYAISDLYINSSGSDYQGLFGYSTGTIRNLGVVNCEIAGGEYTGGLIGLNNGIVTNCYAAGSISGSRRTGGLIGRNYSSAVVTGCYAGTSVTGSESNVGGLIGTNSADLTDCYATGNVTSAGESAGGLIGSNSGDLTDCHATGIVNGTGYLGGLLGENSGVVTSCYAEGNVIGTDSDDFVGGLIGVSYADVTGCYATGDVSGSDDDVGGLIGDKEGGTLSDCYATGDVYGAGDYVGGLLGENCLGDVTNCYAVGEVNGSSYVGGLIGDLSMGSVSYSCYDTTTTGQSVGYDGGTDSVSTVMGYATTLMKTYATYSANWDISTSAADNKTWTIDGILNSGYPYLTVIAP